MFSTWIRQHFPMSAYLCLWTISNFFPAYMSFSHTLRTDARGRNVNLAASRESWGWGLKSRVDSTLIKINTWNARTLNLRVLPPNSSKRECLWTLPGSRNQYVTQQQVALHNIKKKMQERWGKQGSAPLSSKTVLIKLTAEPTPPPQSCSGATSFLHF